MNRFRFYLGERCGLEFLLIAITFRRDGVVYISYQRKSLFIGMETERHDPSRL